MDFKVIHLFFITLIFSACSEPDESPPVLTLVGQQNVRSPLNVEWNDPGIKASDDFDGDISSKVFVESDVNIDKTGFYTVLYSVTDQAGNMASPLSRSVEIYNSAENHTGNYEARDVILFPVQDTMVFDAEIAVDSLMNHRLLIRYFTSGIPVAIYGDAVDTGFVVPFQIVEIEDMTYSLQGSGTINDTLVRVSYTKNMEGVVWLAELRLIKQEE
ncbi:MAG: DUF5011 domain-containing protein [Bacteroidales bacterium]|nr:DUF5011 domain-containing protein [Bacteroidales bacterium]